MKKTDEEKRTKVKFRRSVAKRILSLSLLLCLCIPWVHAQKSSYEVKGVVTDAETGETLVGVAVVLISDPTKGVVTDTKGHYTIKVPSGHESLRFSFLGFNAEDIKIETRREINIKLTSDLQAIGEVAIVGFGTQKKESMVSAITTIKPAELKGPTSNLTTMMAGRVSGVISYQLSGEPGADNANFFVRGLGSFGAGKVDPLILIDGIESTQTDMARLQADDIEAFSVLKDATAAAVYGARGANGVVLITTKGGKLGKTKFDVRVEQSLSGNTRNFDFADNITYMKLANEAVLTRPSNSSQLPYWPTKIDNTAAGNNPYLYPNNDWIKLLIKDYTHNQRYNMSLSGGGEKARYYVAGTFNVDNGILNVPNINNFNSNIKLKNYSLRSNVDINLTSTTHLAVRLYAQFDDYTGPIGGGYATFQRTIWSNPVAFYPLFPSNMMPYVTHPLFGNAVNQNGGLYVNPLAEMVKGYQDKNASNITAQMELKQDLKFITPGLRARVMWYVKRYSYFDVSRSYNPFYYQSMKDPVTGEAILTLLNGGGEGSIGTTGTEYLNYSEGSKQLSSLFHVEGALDYARTFNEKNEVTGMLITIAQDLLDANAGSLQQSLPHRNLGLSGRFTYGYDRRYMAEFNFGYNGSERFAQSKRMGFFPSIGLAYNVSNEKYFKPISKIVTNLKLRATFGLIGNDQIGSSTDRFYYMSEVNMNNSSKGATFGEDYGYHRDGVSVDRYANPEITWEKSKQMNFGIDLGLLNTLNMSVDIYKQNRSNILTDRSFLPSTMGLSVPVKANTNEAESHGIDLAINYNKSFAKNWFVQARANMTYATNKILIYDEPTYPAGEDYRYHVGQPTTQYWGYIAERLFVDDNEVKNSPVQFGKVPGVDYMGGDIKYRDVNHDGVINEKDMVPLGYPTSPEVTYGFGATVGYKHWDLSFFFQGSARSSFFINAENISPFVLNGGSQNNLLSEIASNHWSEDNRNSYAFWPRLSDKFISNNNQTSTWWMRDGKFLRMKNLEIGYTPGKELLKKYGIGNMRVYVNATNLFVLSTFKLWDPEMGGNGIGYPVQSVYNLGVSLSF